MLRLIESALYFMVHRPLVELEDRLRTYAEGGD